MKRLVTKTEFLTVLTISVIITILALLMLIPLVNYSVLAKDVANANAQTLYSGALSYEVLLLTTLLAIALSQRRLRHVGLLIIFLWPIIIALNLLLHGYLLSPDQPRPEFLLGHLVVRGAISFEEASSLSDYFNYPLLFVYVGIFTNIVGLSPINAPVYIMVVLYALLGITLVTTSKALFSGFSFGLLVASALAYTILNPYKILHLCPQIYALTLLVLTLYRVLTGVLKPSDAIILVILGLTLITSHPLTSTVFIGVMLALALMKRFSLSSSKDHTSRDLLWYAALITVIFFIMWNIKYENYIKSVYMELTSRVYETLPPIASTNMLYEVDPFYKFMAFYRYLSLAILAILALIALIAITARKQYVSREKLLLAVTIIVAVPASSLSFIFVPGSFLHRLLYFTTAIGTILVPCSFKLVQRHVKLFEASKHYTSILVLVALLLLSHLSMMEFFTNTEVIPSNTHYEGGTYAFISKYYEFRETIAVPRPISFAYYPLQNGLKTKISIYSQGGSANELARYTTNITPEIVAHKVYSAKLSIVSPSERFILYRVRLFNEFDEVDRYLNNNDFKIFDNDIFKVYCKA